MVQHRSGWALGFGCAIALCFGALGPASAASPLTEAFVANLKPNLAFLKESSALALKKAPSAELRHYAQANASETTRLAEGLAVVRTAALDQDFVLTGRSVAVEPVGGFGQAANGRAPLSDTDVEGLAKLSGRAFLDVFWSKQLDALSQLRADYATYAAEGDDPALVAMATRELPVIERQLALLTKI